MSNPRKPVALARITGADIIHPARHRDRADPPVGAVGAPYVRMTDEEKVHWAEIVADFPWLAISDRMQLRLLCTLAAEHEALGLEQPFRRLNMMRQILNSFGGSPSDRSRIFWQGDDDGEDPADEFLN